MEKNFKANLVNWGVAQTLCHVRFFATPCTVALQAPLSVEFPRQGYWSGLPFPPPGDLSDPGIKPLSLASPALAGGFFTTNATWKAQLIGGSNFLLFLSSLLNTVHKSISSYSLCSYEASSSLDLLDESASWRSGRVGGLVKPSLKAWESGMLMV